MLDEGLVGYVLASLPPPPARVLEVGAGSGELAAHLRGLGYDVVAIDPAGSTPGVEAVPLHSLEASAASFDAALAVLSLHHVRPLEESCRRLASLVRRGAPLVIDEFDVARFDLPAARWWSSQGPATDHEHVDPPAVVAGVREHLHPFDRIVEVLEPWFEFSKPERGPYLYRWQLAADLRTAEATEIESGRIPATGARVVGRRRRS